MIRQNIGILNALLRITCGLTFLSYATAKMVRRKDRQSSILLAMMAAMKVGEGIVRYCPVTDIITNYMDQNNNQKSDRSNSSSSSDSASNQQSQEQEVINPS